LILVDIPIGLPSKDIPQRRCDKDARRILSPKRHSSVFSPPSREALNAESYEAACMINQKITGRKISRQAWGITPKIREMDEFLKKQPEAGSCIRETHPEVCFWSLNGGVPLRYSKKTEAGYRERMAVLTPLLSKADTVVKASLDRYTGKQVARDDVLDALVLSVAGFLCVGKMLAFPEAPEKDTRCLPMEIVYCPSMSKRNPP
jgi:predicted RNase H-like nuclease